MRALQRSKHSNGQHLVTIQFEAYQDGALTEAETAVDVAATEEVAEMLREAGAGE